MQKMFKNSRFIFSVFFAMVFFFVFSFQPIYASMIETGMVINDSKTEDNRSSILTLIEDENVRQQLEQLGVEPEDAYNRVAAMTDTEIREMYASMENLPAGGSPGFILVAWLYPTVWSLYHILWSGITKTAGLIKTKTADLIKSET